MSGFAASGDRQAPRPESDGKAASSVSTSAAATLARLRALTANRAQNSSSGNPPPPPPPPPPSGASASSPTPFGAPSGAASALLPPPPRLSATTLLLPAVVSADVEATLNALDARQGESQGSMVEPAGGPADIRAELDTPLSATRVSELRRQLGRLIDTGGVTSTECEELLHKLAKYDTHKKKKKSHSKQ